MLCSCDYFVIKVDLFVGPVRTPVVGRAAGTTAGWTVYGWESALFASFCYVMQTFVMQMGSEWCKFGPAPGAGRQNFSKSENLCIFGLAGLFGRYGAFWRPVWGGGL